MAKPVVRVKAGEYAFPDEAALVFAPGRDLAMGGSLEGANRFSRETARWWPNMGSPDQIINSTKSLADGRSRDIATSDGYAQGGVAIHKDSIVGAQYLLNSTPDIEVLNSGVGGKPKFDEVWQEEYQLAAESRFNLLGDSEACWLDAAGMNTFTGLVRLVIGGFVWTGEALASAEWKRDRRRPCSTAVQLISPTRLSNEYGMPDRIDLRRGVMVDGYGAPVGYQIRNGYATDAYNLNNFKWQTIPAAKPWGRKQILHIIEQREPGQHRGIADMVAALSHMKMTKNLSQVTLQNAIVQASYATAVESELPPEAIQAMMGAGGGPENFLAAIGTYMSGLSDYIGEANGLSIDGVKIPHLYPGTKLTAKPLGTPGGLGQNFEASLMRHIAAALGVGYEEFARDFSRVSYSSARASMNTTGRFMRARKKSVADRFANGVFQLWLEEDMANGNIPLPVGVRRDYFYVPLMKEAFSACTWVGSGTGQIDELKETQAAILRIGSGLSTWQKEIARLGGDYRKQFAQLAKENALQTKLELAFQMSAKRPPAPLQSADTNDDAANEAVDGAEGVDENDKGSGE